MRGKQCFDLSLFLSIQIISIGNELNFPQVKCVLPMMVTGK